MYIRSKTVSYLDQRNLPTRQFDKIVLRIPGTKLTRTARAPACMGSRIWNDLPLDVQHSRTYKQFKWKARKYLLTAML